MATKAIPGLSLATRIALLQQTSDNQGEVVLSSDNRDLTAVDEARKSTTLQYIIDNDMVRNETLAEIKSWFNAYAILA